MEGVVPLGILKELVLIEVRSDVAVGQAVGVPLDSGRLVVLEGLGEELGGVAAGRLGEGGGPSWRRGLFEGHGDVRVLLRRDVMRAAWHPVSAPLVVEVVTSQSCQSSHDKPKGYATYHRSCTDASFQDLVGDRFVAEPGVDVRALAEPLVEASSLPLLSSCVIAL